ncbi:prolyl oligopeptidase family serine peptidase [Actinokineospora auranticolor]|uniref:Dipeptidyl aminopeptidase/acylaminoacyl peptidase n=1 Tax=Actinokineospora auranticolor TaxID=155976 RepID=A0A2S6GD62_9PSEU|nr:prolyl oligopeptidase family serine peptidase [Actinokineospora auranticolor]PPK63169.1 dipeptidyl aminopeptidase/acylaminoacyl peptidase [Actinokineospora auranticolor]
MSEQRQSEQYGAWDSPLAAADVAAAGGEPRWLMEQWVAAAGEQIWWAEFRPTEGGRSTIVRWTPGRGAEDVLGPGWNVRNRVHEYGARPFAVHSDGVRFVFTNWADQRLYLGIPRAEPVPLTPEPEIPAGVRYADPVIVGAEVWCLRETITGPSPTDVRRDLVAVPTSGAAAADWDAVRVLAASHRFLSGPKVSPDKRHVAWIGWDHPAMPWDGTELCVAPVRGTTVGEHRVLAGGPTESVCQLWWTGRAELTVLTDPDGWWNAHRIGLDGTRTPLWTVEQEIGGALWKPGLSWGAPLADGRIALLAVGWHERDGERTHGSRLVVLDPRTGHVRHVETPHTVWSGLVSNGTVLAGVAAGPNNQATVVRVDPDSGGLTELSAPRWTPPGSEWLPQPRHREFTAPDGTAVHAIVYPPRNPTATAPDDELPPLLVTAHGGPTGRSIDALDPEVTFFTSRGFAVAAVDYAGSTGLGRAYRERLNGQWGVLDVRDCALVATALADEGLVDRDRLVVRGGSAGGWTTCASLTSVSTYRCGTAYYPVLDLLGWATGETHDMESRYLDGLVGPLPEAKQTYVERSPVNRADRLDAPLLLLQGDEDEVCPPIQCERLLAAIDGRGIPHAYLVFPGEQHVFRRAESIRRALEAELSFYAQVLGFTAAGVPRLPLND